MDNAKQDSRSPLEKMLRPRHQVRAFAEYMERVLQQNDHKGGWKEDSIYALFRRAQEELDELRDAILQGDSDNIIKETADVSNFMMMIVDNTIDPVDIMHEGETLIPSHRQLSIAFGKKLAGYEPSEDNWVALDDEALRYAYYGDETTELPFDG